MDIISKRLYNRESLEYGKYKVIKDLGTRGKTKVQYYKIKFKDTSNEYEVSINQVNKDSVIDMKKKKSLTKKKNRVKKKEKKQNKYNAKTTLDFNKKDKIILLALDSATVSTGWSISINGKIKDYGYFYITNKDNKLTTRINFMKKEVEKLLSKYNVNACVMEDVINKNFIATVALSKLAGVLFDTLYERDIPTIKLAPVAWKSKCDINNYKDEINRFGKNSREESKELTYEYVKDKLSLDIQKEFNGVCKEHKDKLIWTDVVDSLAINDICYKEYINRI